MTKTSRQLVQTAFTSEELERIPFWFMRQAGRHLPEYMELRKKYDFEARSQTPELAAKITMQPIMRYDMDVAIIFSDILIPLYSLNRGLKIIPKIGPQIKNPISSPKDVDTLPIISAKDNFPYLGDSMRIVRKELPNKAVAGFSGAPFTLASYLIEGKSTRDALRTKQFAMLHPEAYDKLLLYLVDVITDQLKSQITAGADFVQVFDSWAGFLSPEQYKAWSLPYIQHILETLHASTDVPIMYYSRGSSHILATATQVNFDGFSVDHTVDLSTARKSVGSATLQGNLDPALLLTTPHVLEKELLKITESSRYIFNLATGVNKDTPVANVKYVSDFLKNSWRT